jgi:hypothetical protein
VIDVYKAAAPHLDLVAPDIYNPAHRAYVGFLSAYDRPDNALFVPETGHGLDYARFFFEAMGRGAIGWSPFGMDYTRYAPVFPATPSLEGKPMVPFAANYALFCPIARLWARLAFEGQTWGVAEPEDPADGHRSVLKLGRYTATVSFGSGDFGNAPPRGTPPPAAVSPSRGLGGRVSCDGLFCARGVRPDRS